MWIRGAILGVLLAAAAVARAQSPIQWIGNSQTAIARAQEHQLPLMFWVTERRDVFDDDDLRGAQAQAFRDPIVVSIAHERFVPVRVARNSRVLAEAEKFGLPTGFGLYIALISPDGKLLGQIDPGQVADPDALAQQLTAVFRAYRDQLYTEKLKGAVTDLSAERSRVRPAVQTVWRLGILSADRDMVGLLARQDLTPADRSKIYMLLASFATQPCIEALVGAAEKGDKDAERALSRAEGGALEWLLATLPGEGEATASQIAAYRAAMQVARAGSPKPEAFWKSAKPEDRTKEVEYVRRKAEPVLDYWRETVGKWR